MPEDVLGPEMFVGAVGPQQAGEEDGAFKNRQEHENDPELKANTRQAGNRVVDTIKARGGYCHRRFYAAIFPSQSKVSGQLVPINVEGGAPCVGRFGICQMWDEARKQCIDRTKAEAQIKQAQHSSVAMMELLQKVREEAPPKPDAGAVG